MDGRNHLGRRISLLNESSEGEHQQRSYSSSRSDHSSTSASSSNSRSSSSSNRLPSLPRSTLHSRTSSYASTPVLSPPQTPPLTRSDSSDSRIMQIPSPITPDFAFDAPFPPQQQLPSPLFPQKASFFPQMAKDGQAMVYPPIPQQVPGFVYPQLAMPSAQLFINPANAQVSAPVPAPASPAKPAVESSKGAPSSKGQSKKNQYPCPMAKQFNCPDYFTTSGHAARHAKKHTGRKDAVCPECNKAFTRKDNMEQHRRTHQNGRNAQKGGDDTTAVAAAAAAAASPSSSSLPPRKAAKPMNSKRPKPSPLQPSNEAVPLIDPMLPTSPGSTFSDATSLSAAGLQTLASFSPYMEPTPYRYDLPTSFTAGLDTLAIVATGEDRKRKFDE